MDMVKIVDLKNIDLAAKIERRVCFLLPFEILSKALSESFRGAIEAYTNALDNVLLDFTDDLVTDEADEAGKPQTVSVVRRNTQKHSLSAGL